MPVLLLAGTELVDTGAHLVDQQQGRGDAMSAGRPPRGAGGTHEDRGDDSLPALLPMAAELGLSLDDLAATPDVRQQLSDLFPVRVSMGPPPEGARGAKHRAQIALDAEEGRRIANYAALTAVASAHGLLIPIGPDTDRLCETGEVRPLSSAAHLPAHTRAQNAKLEGRVVTGHRLLKYKTVSPDSRILGIGSAKQPYGDLPEKL